jgi:hypothetical protein
MKKTYKALVFLCGMLCGVQNGACTQPNLADMPASDACAYVMSDRMTNAIVNNTDYADSFGANPLHSLVLREDAGTPFMIAVMGAFIVAKKANVNLKHVALDRTPIELVLGHRGYPNGYRNRRGFVLALLVINGGDINILMREQQHGHLGGQEFALVENMFAIRNARGVEAANIELMQHVFTHYEYDGNVD